MRKRKKIDELIPLTEFFLPENSNHFDKKDSSNVDFNLLLNEIRELKILIKNFISQNVVVNNGNDSVIKRPTPPKKSNVLGYGDMHSQLLDELKQVFKKRKGMIGDA